jgi:hypothetical protein
VSGSVQTAFSGIAISSPSQKRQVRMFPSFDVFQIDDSGRVVWKGFVESVLAARATIQRLMQSSPSDYLILNQSNGERLVVPRSIAEMPGLIHQTKFL